MRPLLVVDGDSFAHRAYHALPKTMRRSDGGPANALVGFTNMLLRLWQDERPRTVLVAWDTLDVPTYRHTALDGYQAGRVFDDELLEQLDLLPSLVSSAALAASAGDVERPRVILGGVNALMICSAEVCSAAPTDSIPDGRASPAARTMQAR